MFQRGLAVLSVIIIGFILYKVLPLIINKYFKAAPIENFNKSTPAPAPSGGLFPSPESSRTVAPGGPNPPNAATISRQDEKRIPAETASDPLVETNMEVPIQDNLRQPERMFSKPVANTGTTQAVKSGIAGDTTNSNSGKFSPDFSQNGGEFMSGIFAHDLTTKGDSYAEI